MFYCPACQQARGWPESMSRSRGQCEICGRSDVCYDVPSKFLPLPPPGVDMQLQDIIARYRALCDTLDLYKLLQHEVAVMFAGLNGDQQKAYIAACERIDNEMRQETGHGTS